MADTSVGIKLSATGAQQVKADLLSVTNGVQLLGNAASQVGTSAASMVASLGAGLVAGLGASAFAGIIKSSVDSAAALHDLSIQTGATVESLSALGSIGKYTDTSTQQIGDAMNKLARNMAGATEESKGTGKALQAIGLDFAKFKDLAPEEQMQAAAKALGEFADGSGKSAAAMALFGKEGAKMLPFFKDLEVAGALSAKVTADQAAAADDFADNLTRLQSSGDAWKKELALGMIPALNLGLQAFVDVTNGAGGLRDGVRQLSKDGSINDWTKTAITGLTYVIDAFAGVKRVVLTVGEGIGGIAAIIADSFGSVGEVVGKVLRGDLAGALKSNEQAVSRQKTMWSELKGSINAAWTEESLGQKIRARQKEIEDLGGAAEKVKPKLNFTNVLGAGDGKGDNSAAKEALSQQISYYEELQAVAVQSLQREQESIASAHSAGLLSDAKYYAAKRDLAANANIDQQAILELEIASVQASDVASKDKVSAIARYNVELTKLKEQQLSIVQKYNDEIDAAEAKQAIATLKAYADQVDGAQQAAAALKAQVQAQLDHNATIGLSVTALADLEAAKLQEQATSKDRLATLADEIDWSGQLGDAYREQAKALRELASAKVSGAAKQAMTDTAKQAEEEWRRTSDQIGQGLANSLMQGGKSAWEYIKGLFRTQLVMRVGGVLSGGIAGLFGGGATAADAATSAGSSALGSAAGSAGTSALFGGASLSSMGQYFATGFMNTVAGTGAATGAAAGSAIGGASGTAMQVGAYAPYAIAAVAALAAIGAFRTTKQVGGGLTGTLGEGDINSYALNRKSGYLFGGPDYSVADQGVAAQSAALQTAFTTSRAAMVSMADTLGIGSAAIKSFTTSIGKDLIHPDTGGLGLKLDGLTADQAATKVQEALATANEEMAQTVLSSATLTGWMARLAAEQTTATTTLQVLVDYPNKILEAAGTSRDALVQTFAQGLLTGDAATAGQSVANQLVASIEQSMLGNAAGQIFDIVNRGIVTPVLDAMLQGQSITEALSQASLDATIAAATAKAQALGAIFNDPKFVQAMQALQTGLGSVLGGVGGALSFTPQYQSAAVQVQTPVSAAATAAGDAVTNLAQVFADARTSLVETGQSLAVDLLRAMGDEMGAQAAERTQYMAGFAKLGQAEQDRLASLYDQNQAIKAQIAAAEKAKVVANELAGLDRQLLELQGNTAAIRALELAALDPSNRALQQRIYALQDEATALDKAQTGMAIYRAGLVGIIDAASSNTTGILAALEKQAARDRKTLETSRAAAQSMVQSVQGIFDTLQSSVDDLFASVDSTKQGQAAQGQQYISAALAAARATGALPDGKELSRAITAATGGLDAAQYRTQAEADFAKLVLANELRDLQSISGDQLTEAERMLGVAEDQLATLDKTLESARDQLDSVRVTEKHTGTTASLLEKFLTALGDEQKTRDAVKASALQGTGQAVYNIGAKAGSNATGQYFSQADAFAAAAPFATGNANDALALYSAAQLSGFSMGQLEKIYDQTPGTLEAEIAKIEDALGITLPRFAVGTNYVPKDMVAMIHEGEAIVPKAYNPVAGGNQGGNNAELLAELRLLRQQNERLEARLQAIEGHTGQFSDQFDRASAGGNELAVTFLSPQQVQVVA